MRLTSECRITATLLCVVSVLIISGCDRKPSAGNTTSKSGPETKNDSATAAIAKEAVENITSYDHFNSVLDGSPGKLLVFDLYADWCRPCKLLAPTYSALAQEHGTKARFFRVDIQQHQDIASAFQASSIPLVVFIKDKEVVKAIIGLNPRESYERVLTTCGPSVPAAECKSKLADDL